MEDKRKKNCNNCEFLEYADGEPSDGEGWCCNKRDYFKHANASIAEEKHLAQLDDEAYRNRSKVCCELTPQGDKG